MTEWDWETNNLNGFNPSTITCGSAKRISWKCPACHMTYIARIPDRIKKNSGCPYCAGKRPVPGVNDLETWCHENGRVDLLEEWKPELNSGQRPSDFLYASNKKIIWECHRCQNQWPQQIDQRTLRNFGCKKCRIVGTSFPEQFLYLLLDAVIGNAKNGYKKFGFEIDIFLEALNIAIEYDGEYYHKAYNREVFDKQKQLKCQNRGIRFLRIKGHRKSGEKIQLNENTISWQYSREKNRLIQLAESVITWINVAENSCYTISSINNINDIYQQALKLTYGVCPEKSLAQRFPHIATEWDYEKNGAVSPLNVSSGSHDLYSWICKTCGHTWNAKVNDRTNGHGCYVCAKKAWGKQLQERAAKKHNFKDWCIENNRILLLEEWDYNGNTEKPEEFSSGSNKSVLWVCSVCDSKYSASISNRKSGTGCKNCWNMRRKTMYQNNKTVLGKNALIVWCKQNHRDPLLGQWDFAKNEYPPDNYTYGSKKVVHWKCSCGHSWPAQIKSRTTQGNGCPNCSRKKRQKSTMHK